MSHGETRAGRALLMCAPTAYGVRYEINPWMSVENPPDTPVSEQQWSELHRTLVGECGARVELVRQQADAPDMVFTANAGLVRGKRVLLSRFRHAERRPEEAPFAEWFTAHGYEATSPPGDLHFEGEGDALPAGDMVVAGYRTRTDIRTHQWVADLLGVQVISVELATTRWYHLDTAFCPLRGRQALWYPAAFDEYAQRALRDRLELHAVPDADAARFACNAVVLGRHAVLPAGCAATEGILHDLGYAVHPVPMSEFIKGGGAAKCLVLHLDW